MIEKYDTFPFNTKILACWRDAQPGKIAAGGPIYDQLCVGPPKVQQWVCAKPLRKGTISKSYLNSQGIKRDGGHVVLWENDAGILGSNQNTGLFLVGRVSPSISVKVCWVL